MAAPSQSVEDALQDALRHSTPAPMLIEIIKAHPTHTTILDLISLYTELVAEQPNQVDKLSKALAEVRTSKLKIDSTDNLGRPEQLEIEPIFLRELADLLSGDLRHIDTSVIPSNEYLIASLISAASRKHHLLCESPDQFGSILSGLYYSDRKQSGAVPAQFEVLVLGACLQLSASGSYLYGPKGIFFGKIEVLSALEVAKKEGVVKDPNGQRLLEATIQQAKSGFKQDLESPWNILFPQEK